MSIDPGLIISANELKKKETDNLIPVSNSVNSHLRAIGEKIVLCQAGYESTAAYDFSNDFPNVDGVELKHIQTLVLYNIVEILEKKGYKITLDMPRDRNRIVLNISWESQLCSKKYNNMQKYISKKNTSRNPRKAEAD